VGIAGPETRLSKRAVASIAPHVITAADLAVGAAGLSRKSDDVVM